MHGCAYSSGAEGDDVPPRSRLFLVVPRDANPAILISELSRFPGCERVKTDLVSQKGICYAKYVSAAAAAAAMDAIAQQDSQIGPYRVKCMPATPKEHPARGGTRGGAGSGASASHAAGYVQLPDHLYDAGPGEGGADKWRGALAAIPPPPMPANGHMWAPNGGGGVGGSAYSGVAGPYSGGAGGEYEVAPGGVGAYGPPSLSGPASGSTSSASAMASGCYGGVRPGSAPSSGRDTHGVSSVHLAHALATSFATLSATLDDSTGGHRVSGAAGAGFSDTLSPQRSLGSPALQGAAHIAHQQQQQQGGYGWTPPPPLSYPPHYGHHSGPSSSSALGVSAISGHLAGGLAGSAHPGARHAAAHSAVSMSGLSYELSPRTADERRSLSTGIPHATSGVHYDDPWPPAASHGHVRGGRSAVAAHGHLAPELSRQRLYVVVSKAATEDQIARQFKKFGGMEYCNLKRDKKTGQSKGYCFVNFSTEESAALAIATLNGTEFPPGSGKPLKVMYSEVLPSRPLPSPPRVNGSSSGSGMVHSGGGGYNADAQRAYAELSMAVAAQQHAVQQVQRQQQQAQQQQQQAQAQAQQQAQQHVRGYGAFYHDAAIASTNTSLSSGMVGVHSMGSLHGGAGGGKAATSARPQAPQQPLPPIDLDALLNDPCVLLAFIERPLPEYALRHPFDRFGRVAFLRCLDGDARYAAVRFRDTAGAAAALAKLDGAEVCGQRLTVEAADNMAGSLRHEFIARVGAVASAPPYGGGGAATASAPPSSHGVSSQGSMQTALSGLMAMPPALLSPGSESRGRPWLPEAHRRLDVSGGGAGGEGGGNANGSGAGGPARLPPLMPAVLPQNAQLPLDSHTYLGL